MNMTLRCRASSSRLVASIFLIIIMMPIMHFMGYCYYCHGLAAPPQTRLPPHSGYHAETAIPGQPFFEGWYLRIVPTTSDDDDESSTPTDNGPLAFIMHVFDPHLPTSSRKGVGLQVMTPFSETIVTEDSDVSRFQADSRTLNVCNRFSLSTDNNNNNKQKSERYGSDNNYKARDWFHLTPHRFQGKATSSSTSSSSSSIIISGNDTTDSGKGGVETRVMTTTTTTTTVADFDMALAPEIGWGGKIGDARQYSTAGWLAAFPVFEPHYQVLISQGSANGSVEITTTTTTTTAVKTGETPAKETDIDVNKNAINLSNAKVYLEKNWGSTFPTKWWWIQCNTFPGDETLCVTSTGAKRGIPQLLALQNNRQEEVALVGIHWKGQFLPFPNVKWTVQWGSWQINGRYEDYSVTLTGSCDDQGIYVRCPTPTGMKETALETYAGKLRVQLYRKDKLLIDATTINACLEIGGLPWEAAAACWKGRSAMTNPLSSIVLNKDFEVLGSDALQLAKFFGADIPGL